MVEPGFHALEQRRQHLDTIRQNSSRLATTQLSFDTHGWGEFRLDTCAYFNTTFIERPLMASGVSIDGDTLIETRFPRVTAGVSSWLQDEKGYYIGCWVFFVVDTSDPLIATTVTDDPNYDLVHDLQFTGLAIKALPSHLLDD